MNQSAQLEFYVSTSGDDTNPGTKEKPFATLTRAQDAVRQLKQTVQGAMTVLVRAGTYYLDEALSFSPEDSGTSGGRVTYRAFPGEIVTLSGGVRIEWGPLMAATLLSLLPVLIIYVFPQNYFISGIALSGIK